MHLWERARTNCGSMMSWCTSNEHIIIIIIVNEHMVMDVMDVVSEIVNLIASRHLFTFGPGIVGQADYRQFLDSQNSSSRKEGI